MEASLRSQPPTRNNANESEVAGWLPVTQKYYEAVPGTPVAAVSLNDYTYIDPGPRVEWMQVLSLASTRIVVEMWNRTADSWVFHDKSVSAMLNSTGPAAVTSQGFGFVVMRESGKNDTIDW